MEERRARCPRRSCDLVKRDAHAVDRGEFVVVEALDERCESFLLAAIDRNSKPVYEETKCFSSLLLVRLEAAIPSAKRSPSVKRLMVNANIAARMLETVSESSPASALTARATSGERLNVCLPARSVAKSGRTFPSKFGLSRRQAESALRASSIMAGISGPANRLRCWRAQNG